MPPKKKRNASNFSDDDFVITGSPEPGNKRPKPTSVAPAQKESGKKFQDDEGNGYWEIGGRLRRVTVSNFKGKVFINIREHYEKDGKVLPGKKGISLSIDQFGALVSALPQIEATLAGQDIQLARPAYEPVFSEEINNQGEESEVEDEEKEEEEEQIVEPTKGSEELEYRSSKRSKKRAEQ